jgi:hypothetical protein
MFFSFLSQLGSFIYSTNMSGVSVYVRHCCLVKRERDFCSHEASSLVEGIDTHLPFRGMYKLKTEKC